MGASKSKANIQIDKSFELQPNLPYENLPSNNSKRPRS
jgi:hypothetical protein